MRHKQVTVLTVLLLAGCAGPARTFTDSPPQKGCNLSTASQGLAAEFEHLRAVQGQFQGGPWNAEVDDWMGRKHQVMIELGSQLGGGDCARTQATDLLGPPDLTAGPGDEIFDLVSRQPEFKMPSTGAYELLIYYWRGAHDYLYFAAEGQTIFSSGWWYAYE